MLEAPRYREGFASVVVDLDRTARLRAENTTWRSDQEDFAADAGGGPDRRCAGGDVLHAQQRGD